LSIARTRTPRRDPLPLHGILRATLETISPQLEEQRLEPIVTFEAQEDEVLGDREQLEGAFLNLFLNAAEAMEEAGRLRVSTTNASMGDGVESDAEKDLPMSDPGIGIGMMAEAGEEEGRKGVRARAPAIRVRIMDDGPGVPDELKERIFDPFFSTKQGGTGFGLPLAVRVMEEHRGALVLAPGDASGHGATFEVFLPLARAEGG
jgi:signal transduction histidine kinase